MPIDTSGFDQYKAVIPEKPKKAPKEQKPIFEKNKAEAIMDLEDSIREAEDFFIKKLRATPENPLPTKRRGKNKMLTGEGEASPCWRFDNQANQAEWEKTEGTDKPVDALLVVSVKWGGKKVPCFPDLGRVVKGQQVGNENDYETSQRGVIPILKSLLEDVKGWEKTSGDGKVAHDNSIERLKAMNKAKVVNGVKRAGRVYDAEKDIFVPE